MATPPVFSAGAVLTAAQMNAVGLWLVSTTSVGSSVSSKTINNVFSSDFDNYCIVLTDVVGDPGTALIVQLVNSAGTPSTTTYAQTGPYMTWTSTTVNGLNGTQWDLGMSSTKTSNSFELYNPYKTQETFGVCTSVDDTYLRMWGWKHTTSASYTGIKIVPQSGTITGGTVSVYGYRA